MQTPTATTLTNDWVTLRPLALTDADAFLRIGGDVPIWRYLSAEPFASVDDAEAWIAGMLRRAGESGDVSFSVFDNATGNLAGSSSYLDVRAAHGGLEIGYTWYGTAYQRTHVNTATKLLLLGHAFDELGANRVQLQTDLRNHRSQQSYRTIRRGQRRGAATAQDLPRWLHSGFGALQHRQKRVAERSSAPARAAVVMSG